MHTINIRHYIYIYIYIYKLKSDTYNSQTLTLTLRVGNTCNKGVKNLSQGVKNNIFKNKLKY